MENGFHSRITFLHFLYIHSAIDSLADARVANMEYDTTRIIGFSKNDRKTVLTAMYNKYVNLLPLETPKKKKSTFTMRKA